MTTERVVEYGDPEAPQALQTLPPLSARLSVLPTHSEQINEIAGALAKAQGKIQVAHKSSDNPYFNSKYADLASVWDACREPLSENGLAVLQIPTVIDGEPYLETLLSHSSGQWIRSYYPIKPVRFDKNGNRLVNDDPQGIGSAITYARRYALSAMVGVAPAETDDDGNRASGRTGREEQRQASVSKPIPTKAVAQEPDAFAPAPAKKQEPKPEEKPIAKPADVGKVGVVENVSIQLIDPAGKGTKAGKPWERFRLMDSLHNTWWTFSSSVVEACRKAVTEQVAVNIHWKVDAKGYTGVESIELLNYPAHLSDEAAGTTPQIQNPSSDPAKSRQQRFELYSAELKGAKSMAKLVRVWADLQDLRFEFDLDQWNGLESIYKRRKGELEAK